jgi:hypothetical protein
MTPAEGIENAGGGGFENLTPECQAISDRRSDARNQLQGLPEDQWEGSPAWCDFLQSDIDWIQAGCCTFETETDLCLSMLPADQQPWLAEHCS